MPNFALFLVAFAASAVEMVEAATIVLAMEVTRGAKSALTGALAAALLLALLVALFAPLLERISLDVLRFVVGSLAFVVGLDWLRKAILRESGKKAKHDEEKIFAKARADGIEAGVVQTGIDKTGFIVSFKAVLLEGLEVVVIVLTIGGAQHRTGVAALGAGAALLVVAGTALIVRKPLARVPENTMKLTVGVMLVSFGTFWSTEGAGVSWPNGDADILGLVAWYSLVALAATALLKSRETVAA